MATLEPPQEILDILRKSLDEVYLDDRPGSEEVLGYCAFLAAGLADVNEFDASVWEEALSPYLCALVDDSSVVEKFRIATEEAIVGFDDAESYGGDDDGAEEVRRLDCGFCTFFSLH
jgi:hypothetical protein